jgi:hypothetical protein
MALFELPDLPAVLRFRVGFREPPRDGVWRKYSPLFPVRLTDGRRSATMGQVWCRFDAPTGRWLYRQDEPTAEEFGFWNI